MSIRFVFRKVCSSLMHFFKKYISWFICWWGICLGEGVFLPNPVDELCTFLGPLWVGVSKFCPLSPLSGLSLGVQEGWQHLTQQPFQGGLVLFQLPGVNPHSKFHRSSQLDNFLFFFPGLRGVHRAHLLWPLLYTQGFLWTLVLLLFLGAGHKIV